MVAKERTKQKKESKTSKAFETQLEKFLGLIDQEEVDVARARYAMGQIVTKLEERRDIYGRGAVDRLAERVERDRSTVYDYGRVARCWSAKQFSDLMEKKAKSGRHLTWSHLLTIATTPNASSEKRSEWVQVALDEDLSVRALERRIQRDTSTKNGQAGVLRNEGDNATDNGGNAEGSGTPTDTDDVARPIDEGVRGIIALTEYSAQQSSRLASLPERLSNETVQPGTFKKIPKVIEDLDAHIRWCSDVRDALQRKLEVQNEE